MLYIIFIAATILFSILLAITSKSDAPIALDIALTTLLVISIVLTITFGINMIYKYVTAESFVAENLQRYEALTSQNYLLPSMRYKLNEKIQNWNEDLAKYKVLQNDFWLGIFVPNIFDQFNFIPMK